MRILKTGLLSNEVSIVNLISDNEMIDVKELRVGNLVLGYCAYNDENDQEQEITNVCRVLSIDSVGAHEYPLWVEAIGKSNDVEEYDGFVAIPLTEEWLLDNGFKLDYDYGNWHLNMFNVYTKRDCHIGVDEDGSCVWYFAASDDFYSWYKNMPYVHTLQNFHFCYLDKELELKPEK